MARLQLRVKGKNGRVHSPAMKLPHAQGSLTLARTVLEVFLSSTAADLKPHRDAIYTRLTRIEFFKCVRQEDFGAQTTETVKYCCERAQTSDLSIGLIGMRRGWEPHGDNAKRSITEMEYDSAKTAGQRQYVWVSPDDFPVPGNLRESDEEHQRQLAFRKRLMGEHIVSQKGFASPDTLASEIVEQLLAHVVTGDLIKLLRPEFARSQIAPIEDQQPAIAAAIEKLAADKDVDLLALANNPQGVDIADLEAKLMARAEIHEAAGQKENETSAEYWRHIGTLAFLHNTPKAIRAYQKATILDPNNKEGWARLGQLQVRLGDLEPANESFNSLISIAQRTNDPRAEAHGHIWKGWVYQSQGDLAAAEASAARGLQSAQIADWKSGMANAYGNMGAIHSARGVLDQAEEFHCKALVLEEELGNQGGVARACGSLGIIYLERHDFHKAEETLRRALAIFQDLQSKDGMAAMYIWLGNLALARGDLTEVEDRNRQALALYDEIGSRIDTAYCYANLGRVYQHRGDLTEAEDMFLKAVALDEQFGRKENIAVVSGFLAAIYEHRADKERLCECLRRARSLWREIGISKKVAHVEDWLKRADCTE